MKFAKVVYYIAGSYGGLVILMGYLSESWVARSHPPAVTHPEYFYGFMGVALAWQVAFLVIAGDPLRYRGMMIPSMIEKLSYGVAVVVLYQLQRIDRTIFLLGSLDWIFLFAFIAAYFATRPRASQNGI